MSQIATIDCEVGNVDNMQFGEETRRQNMYRGMSKEEYHNYYDEAYNILNHKSLRKQNDWA